MKIIKDLSVFALASVITVTCSAVSFASSATAGDYGSEYEGYKKTSGTSFTDVSKKHWAADSIERCVEKNWFTGYPDGSFRPEASINRAEAMTTIVKFLGLSVSSVTSTNYSDVPASEWYAPFIAAGDGLIPTVSNFDGSVPFRPMMPVTREDTAYAIVTALGYASSTVITDQSVLNMFSDQSSISTICKPYVAVGVNEKLISGYDDGTFRGQDPLTRAEFAAMLSRASYHGFAAGGGWNGATTPVVTNPSTQTPSTQAPVIQNPPTSNPVENNSETGIISGAVIDASSNTHVAGAMVTINGVSCQTDIQGTYQITVPAGAYTASATANGFLPGTAQVESVAGIVNVAEPILLVPESDGNGTISGTVYDAQTGVGVSNATITVASVDSSTIVYTNASGEYSVTLPVGSYTARANADGYIEQTQTVVSQINQNLTQDFTLTKSLPDGQVRFVLTWGQTPADLDSHMTGPTINGADRFHISYWNMKYESDGAMMSNLDVDDTNSFGPETVTIYNRSNGVYRYSVHDFTNRYNPDSKEMSNSGAKVEVYIGNSLVRTYHMPPNIPANLWTVCEYDGNTLTDINTVSRCSDANINLAATSGTTTLATTDEVIIYNSLGEK